MRTAIATVLLLLSTSAVRAQPALDTARIEALTAGKGKLDEKSGVFKVSVPRSDLAVVAAGVHLTPAMGLTSWAAFTRVGKSVMVMGDTVLLEDQVNPVMSVALDNGLEVTALHNHFFWESPKVMFMHIGGMGSEQQLAAAVGKVFAKIKETSGGHGQVPYADIDPAKSSLDAAKIEAAVGVPGELKDGVYKVVIGRSTHMGAHTVGNAMGVNTWGAFAGSNEKAVVDGDFAMLESELQAVLKTLRAAGIQIVAIHQHMAGETPRMLFLHYWGIGRAEDLGKALRAALDTTAHDKPSAR
jgi:Domain of Unknown Function (DUF1259)